MKSTSSSKSDKPSPVFADEPKNIDDRANLRNTIRSQSRMFIYAWGHARNPYQVRSLLCFTGVFFVMIISGPLLGAYLGFGAALLWLILILLVPVGMILRAKRTRRKQLNCRMPIESDEFILQLRKVAPNITADFALAVRDALASSYDVPADFISVSDTCDDMMALSRLTSPLALEIVTDVAYRLSMDMSRSNLLIVTRVFSEKRSANVGEFIQSLHTAMHASNE